MRHSILRFFLIFACVAIPLHSHACWDDSSDDYYDYDDYDDDWYDDWYFDDDDWNYDDDDIVYGEISEDNYDMNGGELDEVVVTPDEDYDWGLDDDWWRTDYGDDDDYCNDDEWSDDYGDDTSESNDHYEIRGDDNGDKKSYTLKKTDKLSVDINDLNKQRGFKQGTNNTCVSAGMELAAKIMGNNSVSEGSVLLSLAKSEGWDVVLGDFSDKEKLAKDLVDIANDAGLQGRYDVTDIKDAVNNGEVVMTTTPVDTGGNHDIVIVGYNDDGYIAYDTDKKAGDYIIVPEEDVNGLYKVGIKKK